MQQHRNNLSLHGSSTRNNKETAHHESTDQFETAKLKMKNLKIYEQAPLDGLSESVLTEIAPRKAAGGQTGARKDTDSELAINKE